LYTPRELFFLLSTGLKWMMGMGTISSIGWGSQRQLPSKSQPPPVATQQWAVADVSSPSPSSHR
jgi:hypothetical protein